MLRVCLSGFYCLKYGARGEVALDILLGCGLPAQEQQISNLDAKVNRQLFSGLRAQHKGPPQRKQLPNR